MIWSERLDFLTFMYTEVDTTFRAVCTNEKQFMNIKVIEKFFSINRVFQDYVTFLCAGLPVIVKVVFNPVLESVAV